MADDFSTFLDDHLSQHVSSFNRWCVAIGDSALLAGGLSLLSTRVRRAALPVLGLGTTTVVAGHIADKTLPAAVRGFVRHPLWAVRADATVVRSLLSGASG